MQRIKKLLRIIIDPLIVMIIYWPGSIGYKIRYIYYKKKFRHLGKNVLIDVGVYLSNPQNISIGDNCWIDRGVTILAGNDKSSREKYFRNNYSFKGISGDVIIKNNVHIGINCIISGISAGILIENNCCMSAESKIYSFTHHYCSKKNPADTQFCFGSMVPSDKQCIIEGPVTLEENVGIALHSIILPGTLIKSNSFVAINSVVTGIYETNSYISGNPGRLVKERFSENEL